MKIVVNHFENGEKVFTNESEFISFTHRIAIENEDYEEDGFILETVKSCILYIKEFCDNFQITQINM